MLRLINDVYLFTIMILVALIMFIASATELNIFNVVLIKYLKAVMYASFK